MGLAVRMCSEVLIVGDRGITNRWSRPPKGCLLSVLGGLRRLISIVGLRHRGHDYLALY